MSRSVSDQIIAVINTLGEKLGVAADKLYPILIKQAYVDGIREMVFGGALLGVGIYCAKTIRGLCKDSKDIWYDYFVEAILLTIGGSIGFMVGFKMVYSAIGALANPEWYVIQEILSQITK